MNPEDIAGGIRARLQTGDGGVPRELEPARPEPRVPDHKLLQRIGGGSYGDIWLARSVTGQLRAVKVVWRQNFSSERPYEREFRGIIQFEPISRSHPGVVNVLHVGRDDAAGCFFYVMELADDGLESRLQPASADEKPAGRNLLTPDRLKAGLQTYSPRTLASDIQSRRCLPVLEVLTLGVQLADALGHVHRHGLVHRDVKPSNVIFVGGQSKLADIGLVAGGDEARSFVGTEGFIPPEGPGTERADLFSLGRLLYEAATGRDRMDFPELPIDLDRWPGAEREMLLELNEVLTRACAPDPSKRHANAAELAGDLNLILAGRSVRRAYGVERRLRRATQITVIAAAIALVAAGVVWFQRGQRYRSEARAREQATLRERAEQAEQTGRERLRESLLQEARALTLSIEAERRARALEALRTAAGIRPGTDLRNTAAIALATPELRVVRRWNAQGSYTRDAFGARPDPSLTRYSRCHRDGTVSVVRMEDDTELLRLPRVAGPADFGLFSPDGQWLAVKYSDTSLRIWNLSTRTNPPIVARVVRSAFAFSPDSEWVAAVADDGTLRLVSLRTGQERWRNPGMVDLEWVAFHPNEPLLLATASDATNLDFFRLEDGSMARRAAVPPLGKRSIWSADGRRLITTHSDFTIRLWDWPGLDKPQVISRFHRSEPVSLATDRSGRWLASAGWDNQIQWLDALSGQLLLTRSGGEVYAAASQTEFLWGAAPEWTRASFDPAFVPETIRMHREGKGPRYVAFSPNSAWLATAGPDGIRLLEWETRRVSEVPVAHEPKAISFSTDGEKLYAIANVGMMAWEVRTESGPAGVQFRPLALPPALAHAEMINAAFGADRRRWVGMRRNAGTQRWRWRIGTVDQPDNTLRDIYTEGMSGPELSSDGRWLGWGNWHGSDAFVMDLNQTDSKPIRFESDGSAQIAFSPDSRWFVVAGSGGVRFFEAGSWRPFHTVLQTVPGGVPASIAFTSDSRLCAITMPPNQVRITDPTDGSELITLQTPERHLLGRLAFSPNDQLLAVASSDHDVLVWDLARLRGKLRELGLDWKDPAITVSP